MAEKQEVPFGGYVFLLSPEDRILSIRRLGEEAPLHRTENRKEYRDAEEAFCKHRGLTFRELHLDPK